MSDNANIKKINNAIRLKKKIDYSRLFPKPPSGNYSNLKIDETAMMYITTPSYANQIKSIILECVKNMSKNNKLNLKMMTIADCTSGAGGDIISFSKLFLHVVAFEMDENRFDMLTNNIDVYNLNNVTTINDNCFSSLFNINFADIVYIDPPWGGKSYKNKNNLILKMKDKYDNEYSMSDIINKIFTNKNMITSMIILKLPNNYDLSNLYYNTIDTVREIVMYQLKKMKIVVIYKK